MKFTIKQGSHYTNKRLWIWFNRKQKSDRLAYSVVLSEEAWFEDRMVAWSGWSKIFGFGGFNHHNNSARLVWRPDPTVYGKLIVAAYTYENGEWTATEFSSCYVENAVSMAIKAEKFTHLNEDNFSGYRFYCGKDSIFVEHQNPEHKKKLWPYFGGWDRAYREVRVTLKRINDIKW